MVRRLLAWAAVTALLLSGCIGAPPAATPAIPQPTATPVAPTSTPSPVPSDTPLPAPSDTPTPTETVPTATAAPDLAVISADNAASLVPAAQLALPDFPLHLAWNGSTLLLQAQSGQITVDTAAGTVSDPQPLNLPPGQVMAIAPDGSTLLLRLEDTQQGTQVNQGALYTWDGTLIASLSQPAMPYNAAYSADSRYLAVASADEWAVSLYALPADTVPLSAPLEPLTTLTGFETAAPVYQAIVSNGGKNIAWIARASLQFQDAQTGVLGGKLGYTDFITASTFAPNGEQLALSAPGRLEIYAAPQGELLAGVDLSEPLQDLAYSPDGSLLAAAYASGVQLWDAQTLVPLSYLAAASPAGRISFSPDGTTLASLHGDGTLTIWRAP